MNERTYVGKAEMEVVGTYHAHTWWPPYEAGNQGPIQQGRQIQHAAGRPTVLQNIWTTWKTSTKEGCVATLPTKQSEQQRETITSEVEENQSAHEIENQ